MTLISFITIVINLLLVNFFLSSTLNKLIIIRLGRDSFSCGDQSVGKQ